jgi:hypothetical protein
MSLYTERGPGRENREPIPVSSYWAESQPVDRRGVTIDADRSFSDEHHVVFAELYDAVGEEVPVVAGIRAGFDKDGHSDSQFVILDTRDSRVFNSPYVLVEDGTFGTKGIWADEELVVGRKRLQDRFQYSPHVSAEHFAISLTENGGLHIRDLSSTNGTAVTGYLQPQTRERSTAHIIWDGFTQRFEDDVEHHRARGERDTEAPYGYFRNHPVIGRHSRSVKNGVYGTIHSEQVVVDDRSVVMQRAVQATMRQLGELGATPTLAQPAMLRIIERQVAAVLQYDLEETDRLSRPHYYDKGLIDLSEYVNNGIGVCRHQALLAALFMEEAVARGYLHGSVGVERNHDLELNGAHAWAIFRDGVSDDIIVDPAQHFIGTREQARRQKKWRYIVGTEGK